MYIKPVTSTPATTAMISITNEVEKVPPNTKLMML